MSRRGRNEPRSRPPWVTSRRVVQKVPRSDEQGLNPGAARSGQVRHNPKERVGHPQADPRGLDRAAVTVAQPRGGGAADRHRASCRDVRRLGRVDEVAGDEDPGCARRAVDVTARTVRAGIDRELRQAGELVVGDEVPGEHDDVDSHRAFCAMGVTDEHPVHAVVPCHSDDGCPGPQRRPEADAGREIEGAERLRVWEVGDQRDGVDTRFAKGQYRGIRHVLGSHNERRGRRPAEQPSGSPTCGDVTAGPSRPKTWPAGIGRSWWAIR